jgi:uncharacterized membrane protein
MSHPSQAESSDRLARGLGWLSLALAGPPLSAPRAFCEAIAVGAGTKQQATARVVGARELLAAAGLLTRPNSLWLWSRVAGDAMDLAVLGRALRHHDGRGTRRTVAATVAVASIAAVDLYAALRRAREETQMELTGTTTVNKPASEVYGYWRQLEHLPRFMAHVDDVRTDGRGGSHWTVSAPFGRSVEWDATTTEDVPDTRIAWRSTGDADIENEGSVEFRPAPGDRGTEVHVHISYSVPGGKLGEAVARYFGEDPHQQLDDDLRRLKQVLETGEVIRSEGAPGGKRARKEFPQHPAQPLTDAEFAEEVMA